MPYRNPMGQVYDVGEFEKIMDEALDTADWSGFEARAAQSRAQGKLRGLGIAFALSAAVVVAWYGRGWAAALTATLPGGGEALGWCVVAGLCLLANWGMAALRQRWWVAG